MPQSSTTTDSSETKFDPTGAGAVEPRLPLLGPKNLSRLKALAVALMLSFLLFPRFAPVILYGVVLQVILIAIVMTAQGRASPLSIPAPLASYLPNFTPGGLPFAAAGAFAAWSLIACLWSADPIGGLYKVLILVGMLVLVRAAIASVRCTGREVILAIWQGLMIGLLLGAVYLSIEAVTARGISKFLFTHFPWLQSGYEKHLRFRRGVITNVSDANINRVTAVFTLFLWPALLMAQSSLQGRAKTIALGGLAVASVILMVFSRHQTSQLAILVSTIAFAIAWYAPAAARRLVATSWVAITALVVPLSLAAYSHGMQLSPVLFNTAKARIIIWGYTAEQVLQRPILGVGTNATGAIDLQRTEPKEKPQGYASAKETRAHPHNFYLQVWYELGAIGASLFALLGLAILAAIKKLPEAQHPIAITQFTMTAVMIGSSYGLWQTWLQGAIVFSFIALLMAMKLASPDRDTSTAADEVAGT